MTTRSWHAILTAVAKSEGKTLKEWSDDIDAQAAALYAAVPEYLKKSNLLTERRAS